MNFKNLFFVLMLALILVLLCSAKPVSPQAQKAAETYIAKLSADITLTDSQKTVIRENAQLYFDEKLKLSANKNKDEVKEKSQVTSETFKQMLQSILTNEQQAILASKAEERKSTIIINHQNNQ